MGYQRETKWCRPRCLVSPHSVEVQRRLLLLVLLRMVVCQEVLKSLHVQLADPFSFLVCPSAVSCGEVVYETLFHHTELKNFVVIYFPLSLEMYQWALCGEKL